MTDTHAERPDYIAYLQGLSDVERAGEIYVRIMDEQSKFLESDNFNCTIAETNAYDWDIDPEIDTVVFRDGECVVSLSYTSRGDQDPDKMHCGNIIKGTAEVVFDRDGELRYENVVAEIDYGDCDYDDHDYNDEPPDEEPDQELRPRSVDDIIPPSVP